MAKVEALAEVFLRALRSLPEAGRERVVQGLIRDRTLRRDLMELAVFEERKGEPSRPFRDYLKEWSGQL